MKIAIHNLHYLPQLTNRGGINNYLLEMIKQGNIDYLYFDQLYFKNHYGTPVTKTIQDIFSQYNWKSLGLDKTEIIFSSKKLHSQVDVLLNFNGVIDTDLVPAVRDFKGMKIFHIMDYFWVQPASQQYRRLKELGVDYLAAYGNFDKYDSYFQSKYPDYLRKVIPIPYGFAPRFIVKTPFSERKKKCVALGSVNSLKRPDAPLPFWIEPYKYFWPKEKWMHKFRRMLVEKRKKLSPIMDSLLPVYPDIVDHAYDIAQTLNDYQMFVTCESIYNFPTAKSFEGPAAGSVQVCSDHSCFADLGFIDGINCIKHKELDVDDFVDKIVYYQKNQSKLEEIQKNGTTFVRENYSHVQIAAKFHETIKQIYEGHQKFPGAKLQVNFRNNWTRPKKIIVRSQQNILLIFRGIIYGFLFKYISRLIR